MAKTNLKIKGFDKIITKKLQKLVKTKALLDEIGKFSVERNQAFARKKTPLQGKVVGKFPVGYPKATTVMSRSEIARYNTTHSTYAAKRGNLTITGQLVDGIRYNIKDNGIELSVGGKRTRYKTKSGQAKSNPDNTKVYKDLVDRNRNFRMLGMDEKGRERIKKIILKFLRRLLR